MSSKLASLLVQDGHVTAQRMAEAFQRQVIYGGALDTILLEMGIVDEEVVLGYLGRAAELPVLLGPPPEPPPGEDPATHWLPTALAERFHVAPVGLEGKRALVMVCDPPDREKLKELADLLGMEVEPWVVPEYRLHQARERIYGLAVAARFASLARRLRQRAEAPGREARRGPTRPNPIVAETRPLEARAAEKRPEPPPVEKRPAEPPPAEKRPPQPPPVEKRPPQPPPVETRPPQPPPVEKRPPEPAPVEKRPVEPAPVETRPPQAPPPPIEAAVSIEEPSSAPVAVGPPPPAPPVEEPPPPPVETAPPPPEAVPEPVEESPAAHYRIEAPAREPAANPEALAVGSVTPISLEEGLRTLAGAEERDAIFVTLCRIARSRFPFAAVFTVQGERATARVGLADTWLDRSLLAMSSVPLDQPSSFRAAIHGRAPYLGRVDDDPPTSQAMAMLGRPHQLRGALLPVVIRDRSVAVLHVDDQGRSLDATEVVDLITATAAASSAFQRLILRAKAGQIAKAPTVPAPRAHSQDAPIIAAPAPRSDLRKRSGPMPATKPISDGESTSPLDPRVAEDAAAALAAVERGGPGAGPAGELLVSLGPDAARLLAARLPGPLSLDRHAVDRRGTAPPLADHGALLALVPRFGHAIVAPIVARLADPSLDVRYYAAMCLGELRFPEAIAPLGARLFDPDSAVRRAAAGSLARYAPGNELRSLLESLRGELLGPDATRQLHSAEAVGELRDAVSIPRLVELVKHRELEVVETARRALVQITKQDFGNSRWRWRSWWDRNRELSRLEWLLAGLAHKDPEVRASSSDELQALENDYFGFHRELPQDDRDQARQKWLAWYKATGVQP